MTTLPGARTLDELRAAATEPHGRLALCVTLYRLAKEAQDAGDLGAAQAFAQERVTVAQALAESAPDDAPAQREQIEAQGFAARLMLRLGEPGDAWAHFAAALRHGEALLERDPHPAHFKRLILDLQDAGRLLFGADAGGGLSLTLKGAELADRWLDVEPESRAAARLAVELGEECARGLYDGQAFEHAARAWAVVIRGRALLFPTASRAEEPTLSLALAHYHRALCLVGEPRQGELASARAFAARAEAEGCRHSTLTQLLAALDRA